jgi:hypothetical protein
MMNNEPLGKQINQACQDVRDKVNRLKSILGMVPACDDNLPRKSRLNELHLDDLRSAAILVERAAELVANVTPEALEND